MSRKGGSDKAGTDELKAIIACAFLLWSSYAAAQSGPPEAPIPAATPLSVTLPTGMKLTAFGVVDVGLSYFNNVANATNTGSEGSIVRAESGVITVSKLGLSGEQPLDHILGKNSQFVFDLEPGFDVVKLAVFNRNSFLSRNAWVGLASDDFGAFRFGRQWNFNDDFLNASYYLPGYRLSVFRLTEFGELSDIHDNVFKYLTPVFDGFQAGAYAQVEGDSGVPNKVRIDEAMGRYSAGAFSMALVYDRESDSADTVISQMPSLGASYTMGAYKFRTAYAFNVLYPGISPYPGGAGPISVPVKTQVNLYVAGLDWSATKRLTLSGDFAYRDDLTAKNNTQVYRVFADYIVNQYIDVYSQLGFERNNGGAAESFYSAGASSYLGSGYPDQSQFAFINGVRFKF